MIVIDMDMPRDCSKCKLLMQCKGYYYIENKLPDTCPIKCDIEDIKTEIEKLQGDTVEVADFQGNRYTYESIYKADVLAIIDKYLE